MGTGDYGWLQKTDIYNPSNYNMNQKYKLDTMYVLDKYSSLKVSISRHLFVDEPSFSDMIGVSGLEMIEWLSRSDKAENFKLTDDTVWCKKIERLANLWW